MKQINETAFTSDNGLITFIHGDCMEFMAGCKENEFDLAVVDPPYENKDAIGLKDNTGVKKQAAKRTNYKVFENIAPTPKYWEELKKISKNQIAWGGNYFGLKGGVIAWNKNGTAFGEVEIAICTTHNSVRFFEFTWNGMIQQNMKDKEIRQHPTQKPIQLYRWIFKNYAKPTDRILDTHGGSMSSAIAAHMEGLRMTIIELDDEYFQKSLKRFANYERQQTINFE